MWSNSVNFLLFRAILDTKFVRWSLVYNKVKMLLKVIIKS